NGAAVGSFLPEFRRRERTGASRVFGTGARAAAAHDREALNESTYEGMNVRTRSDERAQSDPHMKNMGGYVCSHPYSDRRNRGPRWPRIQHCLHTEVAECRVVNGYTFREERTT